MLNRIRFLAGAFVGATAQYLLDPKSGPARRANLGRRVSEQAQEIAGQLRSGNGLVAGLLGPIDVPFPAAVPFTPDGGRDGLPRLTLLKRSSRRGR